MAIIERQAGYRRCKHCGEWFDNFEPHICDDVIDARADVTGRLENWELDTLYNQIWGEMHDDVRRRFKDGTWVHTSRVPNLFKLDLKEGDIVKTQNSSYLLGKKSKINP